AEYRTALHILTPASASWSPPVILVSGLANEGRRLLWSHVLDHRSRLTASGEITQKRSVQNVKWMWALLDDRLKAKLKSDPALKRRLPALEAQVADGRVPPTLAAEEIARLLGLER